MLYQEMQLRLWLMIIPFWVGHIFGVRYVDTEEYKFAGKLQKSFEINTCMVSTTDCSKSSLFLPFKNNEVFNETSYMQKSEAKGNKGHINDFLF